MQIFAIIALVFAVVAVILLLQNMAAISLSIFLWNIHTSLAVVLLIALGLGILISVLLLLPASIRNQMSASGKNKALAVMEEDRNQYKTKYEEAAKEVATLEEQLASFSAALENKQSDDLPGEKG